MVATIQQARDAVYQYLQQMNHSPNSLNITSFDTKRMPWRIQGQFQNGFMGDFFSYEADFNPTDHLITRLTITGLLGKPEGL